MIKVKYGKILLVVCITVLIWVWADLATDEDFTVFNTTINVAKSAKPSLWVSFDGEPTAAVKKMILRGPVSKITEVRRKLNDGSLVLEFFLNPEEEKMTTARQYMLDIADFLKRSDQIKQLGLKIKACEPEKVIVDVADLVEMPLTVICIDEERLPVKTAVIEPAQVRMFVPKDWSGERLTAGVSLSRREINQARSSAVEKTPYIELAAGQIRDALTTVKVRTPLEEEKLNDYTITTAKLGVTLSLNLQGKYVVEVTNLDELIRSITIRATPDAKRAYDKMRYQVILEIDDSDRDVKSAEPLRKELVYNFPPEYACRDEIMLNQQPAAARFNLVPVSSAEPAPAQ